MCWTTGVRIPTRARTSLFAVEPTQPTIQWATRTGREADHLHLVPM